MSRDVTHVLENLVDTSQPLLLAGLYALSGLDRGELRQFQSAWADIPLGRRRELAKTLLELTEMHVEYDFNTIFRWNLHDSDPVVRSTAVEGLWEDEDPSLIGPLINLLQNDDDNQVRAASATALGHFVLLGELEEIDAAPAMRAEQALLNTIETLEESVAVRRRAVESIAYSSEAGVHDIIEAAYNDDDELMRISALFAMGRSADTRWRPIVLTELANPQNELRFEAARACGELELSAAVPHLVQLISDEDSEIVQIAIWSLGRIGGSEAQRALRHCAASDDGAIREAAEEALAEIDLFSGLGLDTEFEDGDDAALDWDFTDEEDEEDERAWDGNW